MVNQLLKWTLLISLWRKYKKYVGATVILLGTLMLTSLLHQDYVDYSLAANNQNLGLSYLIKWVVYFILVTVYWLTVGKINAKSDKNSDLHKQMNTTSHSKVNKLVEPEDGTDPFANIRKKKTLRSKADITIESVSKEKDKL